jgi:hypothetical protein
VGWKYAHGGCEKNGSFFVNANGALLACGAEGGGEAGVLGLQEGTSQTSFVAVVPTSVPSMAGVRIRAVTFHDYCNLAVSEAGQVFEWGRNVQPSLEQHVSWSKQHPPVPTVMEELRNHRVRQVVAGYFHCAELTEDVALFTWETRRDIHAQPDKPAPELGYGSYIHDLGVPYRVFALKCRIRGFLLYVHVNSPSAECQLPTTAQLSAEPASCSRSRSGHTQIATCASCGHTAT